MKIVMAGLSGHFEYALPYMRSHGLVFDAVYSDGREETRDGEKRLSDNGFGIPFGGTEEELYRGDPDICIVNSIPGLNAGFAINALKHGCAVFCEKPLATDMERLAGLYEAYRASGRHLAAMFGTSFTPHVSAAKKAVGLIGSPMLITAQKSYKLGRREDYYFDRGLFGGIIPWVSIHSLDWMYSITKLLPEGADAVCRTVDIPGRGEMEIEAVCIFSFGNGAVMSCTADYLRPAAAPTHDDDRMRIAGSDGVLEISKGTVRIIDKDGERLIENEPAGDIFEDFISGMRGLPCENTAEKAFALTKAALEARDSADRKR